MSPASFNNEVGLPLTILGAPEDTEVLVAEMGARRAGDVKLLAGIARPDVVVVTNVGVAHMEIFGSWASIVDASAEPVDALDADGVAILNADDAVAAGFSERAPGKVVTFGTRSEADVRGEGVSLGPDGLASFRVVADGEAADVTLREFPTAAITTKTLRDVKEAVGRTVAKTIGANTPVSEGLLAPPGSGAGSSSTTASAS